MGPGGRRLRCSGWALFLALTGCGGDLRVLDIASVDDGWKQLVFVDPEGRPVRSSPPFEVRGGRADQTPVAVERHVEVWLLELSAELGLSPHGRVDDARVVPGAPPRVTAYELTGSLLLVRGEVGPGAVRALRPDAGGALVPVPAARLAVALESLTLARRIETEPCPAPIGPLQRVFADVFAETPQLRGRDVVELHAPDSETIAVLAEHGMVLARGRWPDVPVPGLPERGDVLRRSAFGPGSAELRDLQPLDGHRYLVGGEVEGGGGVWVVERGPDGLEVVGTATVPEPAYRVGRTQDRFWMVDRHGAVRSASDPLGPWEPVTARWVAERGRSRMATSERQVAYSVAGRLGVLGEPAWPARQHLPPEGRSSRVESLVFAPDGGLWIGLGEGDVGVVTDGLDAQWTGLMPARLRLCGPSAELPRPHLVQEVRRIRMLGPYAVVMFDRCSVLWTIHRKRRCHGAFTMEGLPAGAHPTTLFVGPGRLVVGTMGGGVYQAPIGEEQ